MPHTIASLCTFSNDYYLVSFSDFPQSGIVKFYENKILLLDKNYTLLRYTSGIKCKNAGEVFSPDIKDVFNDKARLICEAGDGGYKLYQEFALDLNTFEFEIIKDRWFSVN